MLISFFLFLFFLKKILLKFTNYNFMSTLFKKTSTNDNFTPKFILKQISIIYFNNAKKNCPNLF